MSYLEQNLFECTFECLKDRDKVIEACPWSIKGQIIVLQQWAQSSSLEELSFRLSPFWVQIHRISLNRMNEVNIIRFGELYWVFHQVR